MNKNKVLEMKIMEIQALKRTPSRMMEKLHLRMRLPKRAHYLHQVMKIQASHVAVIVDFQPNPNQGNETWPMIVDQAGPLPSDQLPRFIDQTENPDIMQVDIVFIGR